MNRRIVLLWVLALAGAVFFFGRGEAQVASTAGQSSCVQCHSLLAGRLKNPVLRLRNDIHAEKGLSCENCHGGDPTSMDFTVAKSKEKGFVGVPKKPQVPEFCSKCHGDLGYMRRFNPSMPVDQLQAYRTSVHGKRLAQGDKKVATCINCHGAHGILQASKSESTVFPANIGKTCSKCHADKEYMKDYKIPTDQMEKYSKSVHGELLMIKRDLSAPTCNDCHGNHGAFPPNVSTVSDMCGQCHVNNRNLFVKSPHKAAFGKLRLPECAICHSNHDVMRTSDTMIGDQPPAVCIRCHAKGSRQIKEAVRIREEIETLKSSIHQASKKIEEAEHLGMEVSEAKFSMKDANSALIKVRTEVHSLSSQDVKKKMDVGTKITSEALKAALAAIEEFHARRRWVILPIVLTFFLAGVLYLKLRQYENSDSGKNQ